jgi:hypothetical protein
MTHDQDTKQLEELDAEDREQLERVERVVAHVMDSDRPSTVLELSQLVRQEMGEVDNLLIRAALLRLLNSDRLKVGNGKKVSAAG